MYAANNVGVTFLWIGENGHCKALIKKNTIEEY